MTIDYTAKNERVKQALVNHLPYYLLVDGNGQTSRFNRLYLAMIQVGTDRVPLRIVLSWYGKTTDWLSAEVLANPNTSYCVDKVLGYAPAVVLDRYVEINTANGFLAEIVSAMIDSIQDDPHREGAWSVNKEGTEAEVLVQFSKDSSRRNNGGEYDYYRKFRIVPSGVISFSDWSAEFYLEPDQKFYPVTIVDLYPILEEAAKIASQVLAGQRTSVCPCCGRPYTHQS